MHHCSLICRLHRFRFCFHNFHFRSLRIQDLRFLNFRLLHACVSAQQSQRTVTSHSLGIIIPANGIEGRKAQQGLKRCIMLVSESELHGTTVALCSQAYIIYCIEACQEYKGDYCSLIIHVCNCCLSPYKHRDA